MSSVLLPLVERLSIVTKELDQVRLQPNWAQMEVLETVERQLRTTGRVRIIILKARQMGLSTITEAILFWMCFLVPGYRARIVCHELQASHNLLAMSQNYWETFPFYDLYSTKYQSRNELYWDETKSFMRVDTVGAKTKKGVGRSATITGLHASEVAMWDNPELIMQGLRNSIPSTGTSAIILESTAKGRGNYFHRTWEEASAGNSEFVPLFFPWWKHYEYTASFIGLKPEPLGVLDKDEKALRAMGVDDDHLQWRRYAIPNLANHNLMAFMEEYPSTPEEAFIATGLNVFPYPDLLQCFRAQEGIRGELVRDGNQVEMVRTDTGRLTVFKKPSRDKSFGDYIVCGDPTHTMLGDPACAQVINRRTMEQVAEWRGPIDAATFGEELMKLGLYYNTALVSCEANKGGGTAVGVLMGMNYPRVWQSQDIRRRAAFTDHAQRGWMTTNASKPLMINALLKLVAEHAIEFHSSTLFSEMADYVTDETGTFGPADQENGHDDTVMAMAQAAIIHMLEGAVVPYTLPDTPAPSSNVLQLLGFDDPTQEPDL